jgi:predicted HAD superfamily phosphohydrolase YqeG
VFKTRRVRAETAVQVRERLEQLGVRSVVFDVEPLVALWDSDRHALADGVSELLELLTGSGVKSVVFATNSARTPPQLPEIRDLTVKYVASARKPLRTAHYRPLPRPVAVVGDQVATDGLLAWRLGCTFVRYDPSLPKAPPGPRVMAQLGRLVKPLIFRER